jgi:two-component system, NarL family, nitrate/nitrite response regulator NarL
MGPASIREAVESIMDGCRAGAPARASNGVGLYDQARVMLRVAIVCDGAVPRFVDVPGGEGGVLAEAAGAAQLIDRLTSDAASGADYDVVLLDARTYDAAPLLALVARLSAGYPVLLMSTSDRAGAVLEALRTGARGCVTPDCSAQVLTAAAGTVAAGGIALSAEFAGMLQATPARYPDGPAAARPDLATRLSAREDEALSLIANGYTHAQVARRMGVTKSTVDTYVERIRTKLKVGNKADLTRAAIERRHAQLSHVIRDHAT